MYLQNNLMGSLLKEGYMMNYPYYSLALCAASLTLIAGCVTSPAVPDSGSVSATQPPTASVVKDGVPSTVAAASAAVQPKLIETPTEPTVAEKNLAAAVATFDRGEYVLAIRQLTPLAGDSTLDKASQLRALKTLAFSQCLSRATTACRQTFERAFRLDGKFDLAPAERGHPAWGPEFERARKAVAAQKGK